MTRNLLPLAITIGLVVHPYATVGTLVVLGFLLTKYERI